MDIDVKEVKKELDENFKKGGTFRGLIEYTKYRYFGQESIPMEIIEHILDLPYEVSIMGVRPKQAGGAGC